MEQIFFSFLAYKLLHCKHISRRFDSYKSSEAVVVWLYFPMVARLWFVEGCGSIPHVSEGCWFQLERDG